MSICVNTESGEHTFPCFFKNFSFPDTAKHQNITVYRACSTHKIEYSSFLPSFIESHYKAPAGLTLDDPRAYSVSTYLRVKDLKRFCALNSKFQPPWVLAKGEITVDSGLCCQTSDYIKGKNKRPNSHVDWWVYEGIPYWETFHEVNYDDEL